MRNLNPKKGFTLLELSVVLVVIGLIAGVITIGQEMVQSAARKSLMSQVKNYSTIVNTFKLKYSKLPGDIDTASNYWPGHTDGDGNRVIDQTGETKTSWQHLQAAELIPGNFPLGTAGQYDAGIDAPASELGSAGLALVHLNAHNALNAPPTFPFLVDRMTDRLVLVTTTDDYNDIHTMYEEAAAVNGSIILPVEHIRSIDMKIDDGVANDGTMVSLHCVTPNNATATLTGASVFDYDQTTERPCITSFILE
jgi:prepilin-type N-terminal cleavage/methylation domain-containing protein